MRGRESDMGPKFFQTRMGQRYYEVTAPKIATELARLADNVAALNETLTQVLDAGDLRQTDTAEAPASKITPR